MQQVCGSLEAGFSEVNKYLQEINFNISELRGEITEMASMLDWRLSLLIEEQRLTNQLLGHIAQLLRIPDSQKQRVYYIEQGLKYLKNAILEGTSSTFYADALEGFKEAERIERKDYITLNRIGQIHLYSKDHLDIALAEQYFLKSAREAFAEANANGTTTSRHLTPYGHQSVIYSTNPFNAAMAEAYLYAGRSCYLQGKLTAAIEYAAKAYSLFPEFVEAGFEQAKYLGANNQDPEAAVVLETVISKDRYFAVKTLSDGDLATKPSILKLLAQFHAQAIARATREYDTCAKVVRNGSLASSILEEARSHITANSFLSGMKALDLLNANYQLQYNEHNKDGERIRRRPVTPSQRLVEFIKKENQSAEQLEELRERVHKEIITARTLSFGVGGAAIGCVVGFFRGCSVSSFSVDGGTWFATLMFCAISGAVIGLLVGYGTQPSVE